MKTGNTGFAFTHATRTGLPQWSPVMKTGNTALERGQLRRVRKASMEPGHEDREYPQLPGRQRSRQGRASMEPGHEDREYHYPTQKCGHS